MKSRIIILLVFLFTVLVSGCKPELEIKEKYNWDVTHLPYREEVLLYKRVKIECEIKTEEGWVNTTELFLRHFSYKGNGEFYLNDMRIEDNITYPLTSKNFTLYYLPQSLGEHHEKVWVKGTDGQERTIDINLKVVKNE